MIEVVYCCEDGTPFPVSFATDADAAAQWVLEQEHFGEPMPPLLSAMTAGTPAGIERAYGDFGLPVSRVWSATPPVADGYSYFLKDGMDPEHMAALFAGCGVLLEQHGSALGIWRDANLPLVREACAWIRDAGPEVGLVRLQEEQAYAFHLTMISAMVAGNDQRLMVQLCEPLYPGQGELVAYELTQGYDNETVTANQRLYEVAQLARASERAMAALDSADPKAGMDALRSAGEDRALFAALDAFLADYGWRSETWSVSAPTWGEQGPGLWAQIAQMARDGVEAPADALAAAADRRRAVVGEIEAKLADDPELLSKFRRRYERLAVYVPVREERALWQLVTNGSLRHAVLRRGALAVAAGAVDDAADIFLLELDEVERALAGADLRATVEERRADHARRCALEPPRVIGGASEHRAAPDQLQPGDVLTGVAGARGEAVGAARVIVDLADAERLEAGDVLVCIMTAPPWTPLFGVASAVVVDSGGLGSHPAIAAREYGIPCVLATKTGTRAIPDGAKVAVDGVAGTVRLL